MIDKKYLHSQRETVGVFFGNGSVGISPGVSVDGKYDNYPIVLTLTDETENPQEVGFNDGILKNSDDIYKEKVTLFFKNENSLDLLLKRLIEAKSYFCDIEYFKDKLLRDKKQQDS